MSKIYQIVVAKTGETLEYDWDTLPDTSKEFAIEYGLRQYVNDGHAGATVKAYPDEAERLQVAREGVAERDENLRTGNFARKARMPVDVEQAFARKMGVSVDRLREIMAANASDGEAVVESAAPKKSKKAAA